VEIKGNAAQFLTAGQVAKRLDVNISTVGRWVKSGRLEGAELPSGGYVIPVREVERFEAERSLREST
jgi:excisionase family DNA binding protein